MEPESPEISQDSTKTTVSAIKPIELRSTPIEEAPEQSGFIQRVFTKFGFGTENKETITDNSQTQPSLAKEVPAPTIQPVREPLQSRDSEKIAQVRTELQNEVKKPLWVERNEKGLNRGKILNK